MKLTRIHENQYYIGVDFGHHTVSMSALDYRSKTPFMLDRTGGYGQIYVPAQMMYLPKEHTWLIGEEATMMRTNQDSVYVENVLTALYERKSYDVEGVSYKSETLIAIYINELLKHLDHVNPNNIIKGLTITLPDQVEGRTRQLLVETLTFYFEKTKKWKTKFQVHVITNVEAMLMFLEGYHLVEKKQCYFMDFGHDAFRVYDVHFGSDITISLMIESKMLSGYALLEKINNLLSEAYLSHRNITKLEEEESRQIQDMCIIYYAYLLKAYQNKKDLKITYRFPNPPFQIKLQVSELIKVFEPIESAFEKKLNHLKENGDYEVVVMGNGFRTLWPKVHLYEKAFSILVEDLDAASKGAALWSLKPLTNKKVNHIGSLVKDYGVIIEEDEVERFLKIARSGSYFANAFIPVGLIMVREKDLNLKIYTKDANDKIEQVASLELSPKNNEAIYRVTLKIEFDQEMHLVPTVLYDEL